MELRPVRLVVGCLLRGQNHRKNGQCYQEQLGFYTVFQLSPEREKSTASWWTPTRRGTLQYRHLVTRVDARLMRKL